MPAFWTGPGTHDLITSTAKWLVRKMVKRSEHIPHHSRKSAIISITTTESWNLPSLYLLLPWENPLGRTQWH